MKTVEDILGKIEEENNVKILYATETGSYSYNWHNPGQEKREIFFIYSYKPEKYTDQNPVNQSQIVKNLETEETIDDNLEHLFQGIELFKFTEQLEEHDLDSLELVKQDNNVVIDSLAPEFERYVWNEADPRKIHEQYRKRFNGHFSSIKQGHTSFENYLKLLWNYTALKYVEAGQTVPFRNWERLLNSSEVPQNMMIRNRFQELAAYRRRNGGDGECQSFRDLHEFFDNELERDTFTIPVEKSVDTGVLNVACRKTLERVWKYGQEAGKKSVTA